MADVADLKERFGDAVLPLALDVTDPEQVQQVVQQAYGHFGRLDVLVNNAGVSLIVNMERGDPQATPDAILKVVDAENPPLRLAVGSTVLPTARTVYADRIATWEAWENVSNAAQGDTRKGTPAS